MVSFFEKCQHIEFFFYILDLWCHFIIYINYEHNVKNLLFCISVIYKILLHNINHHLLPSFLASINRGKVFFIKYI